MIGLQDSNLPQMTQSKKPQPTCFSQNYSSMNPYWFMAIYLIVKWSIKTVHKCLKYDLFHRTLHAAMANSCFISLDPPHLPNPWLCTWQLDVTLNRYKQEQGVVIALMSGKFSSTMRSIMGMIKHVILYGDWSPWWINWLFSQGRQRKTSNFN